jgi:hypothetical protein
MTRRLDIGGGVYQSLVVNGDGNTVNFVIRNEADDRRCERLPPHHFDRAEQKDAIRRSLREGNPGLFPLRGESGQGHKRVAEFCFQSLKKTPPLRRVTIRDWPRVGRAEELVGELCERVAKGWFSTTEPESASAPDRFVALARELAPGAGGVFVEHQIASPTRDDVRLLGTYLEHVWKPLLTPQQRAPAVLVFQFWLEERTLVGRMLSELLRWGDRGACKRALEQLDDFSRQTGVKLADVPELEAMSIADLEYHYPREEGDNPAEIRAKARALHRDTHGRFDAIADQLFPSEAV